MFLCDTQNYSVRHRRINIPCGRGSGCIMYQLMQSVVNTDSVDLRSHFIGLGDEFFGLKYILFGRGQAASKVKSVQGVGWSAKREACRSAAV